MIKLKTLGDEEILLDASKPRDEIVSLFFPGVGTVPWGLEIGKGFYLTMIIPGYSLCERVRCVLGRNLKMRNFKEGEITVTYESPGNTREIFRELREKGVRMKFRINGGNIYIIR